MLASPHLAMSAEPLLAMSAEPHLTMSAEPYLVMSAGSSSYVGPPYAGQTYHGQLILIASRSLLDSTEGHPPTTTKTFLKSFLY
jgi:hypothetical protein